MREVFERAMFLEMCNYTQPVNDCVSQAIDELLTDDYLYETYNIFGINHEEFVQDMTNAYLHYKKEKAVSNVKI